MISKKGCKADSILIVAAEASSCMYAKNFMKAWLAKFPETHFYGVGDKEMQALGMECFGFAEDMAVVGLVEVLKHYSEIKAVADRILEKSKQSPPSLALLLDYPGFNLRLAPQLKVLDVPVVYYISPQLWAWKKGRVKTVKKFVDDMLVVFPFEVDFYQEHGVEAHFVGHPLIEVVEQETQSNQKSKQKDDVPVLGLMPGSRKSEVHYNFTTQLDAAKILSKQMNLKVRVLLAPTLTKEDFFPYLDGSSVEVEFVQGKPTEMIQDCDYILTASGTATLQVALCEKPMVVMYKMNSVTAFLAKRLVNTVDSFCIVNLIAGKEIVPELFQNDASPQNLAQKIGQLIQEPDLREQMLSDLKEVKKLLGSGKATEQVVNYIERRYR